MGVKVVETALRDGHQSLFATRMTTDEVLEALPELDKVGYHAIEIWGDDRIIAREYALV